MEVIRLDEEPVSKTGAGETPVVGSSPTASAWRRQETRTDEGVMKSEVGIEKPNAPVRQLAERLGLNPSECGFESRLGHR